MRNRNGLGCIILIAVTAIVLVITFAIFALFDFLQRMLLVSGEDWLFYEPMPYAQKMIIFPVVILMMEGAMAFIYRLTGMTSMETANNFMKMLYRFKIPVIIICVAVLYTGFTGISSADANGITRHSALDPIGTTYDLELVSSVDTGFKRDGSFYYEVQVDGKTLKFNAPTVNSDKYPEYYENEYKAILDFDQKLMALGVTKNADVESISRAEYDESCMQYFREIVK